LYAPFGLLKSLQDKRGRAVCPARNQGIMAAHRKLKAYATKSKILKKRLIKIEDFKEKYAQLGCA
jgi:hypothetical protein